MDANDTRNQHFLAQVEQRLNALNPHARRENLRIYSFKILDRENHLIDLEKPKGNLIRGNMSLFDLFSFDVLDDESLRLNFESLFQKYERCIESNTKSLLEKLNAGNKDIYHEIMDIFAAKFVNFVRNPFCIGKVLNTFPDITGYNPTDHNLLAIYQRILSGKKPQQEHLCRVLGIDESLYIEWLRILFMLLTPLIPGAPNFLESIIKSVLEDRKNYVAIHVCEYDDANCLLSDRGFSQPIADLAHMGFSFNLCSKAFVHYRAYNPAILLEGKADPEFLKSSLAMREQHSLPQMNVRFHRNDLDLLAQYNRRTIEQCHERVYCASKEAPFLSRS